MTSPLPEPVEIAVIGGTGVYGVEGLTDKTELKIDTPFGAPSCSIVVGRLEGVLVAFLARHDIGHRLIPTEIPFRANIWALKLLGVKYLLTFGACGSLKQEVAPQHVVLVDQFIDRTKARPDSFFGNGVIAHVALADPVCPVLTKLVKDAIEDLEKKPVIHLGGTYVCIEGPSFSTRAESNLYRSWGCSVIGMTAVPEFKLAREAEMSYAHVSLVTDYDCWHPDHDSVTVDLVMENLKANGDVAQRIVRQVVKKLSKNKFEASAHSSLKHAILSHLEHISAENRNRLGPILHKYLPKHD